MFCRKSWGQPVKKAILLGSVISLVATSAMAWTYRDQTTVVEERVIPLQLTNGDRTDQGTITYRVLVRLLATQTGSSSKWDHPIDDRQCSITAYSEIHREVCFQTILGVASCNNPLTKPLAESASYTPSKNNFLDYDPCPDYHDRMASLVRSVTVAVSETYNDVISSDLDDLRQQLSGQGVDVTYEN